ncbi:MAG: hypothetical protein HZA93_11380 [Verrucomicrobia bacterium]|nr:hypothetical protein [Verrucomicrobiota bacterium]
MTPSPDNHEQLERLIDRTLRDLPPRRAPRSLELRVVAEIERRAALPWWRQSYSHWPVAVRAGFFVGTAALAALLVVGLFSMVRVAGSPQFADTFAWFTLARDLGRTGIDTGAALWRAIPPLWLYGGLALIAACYATLIGVGAAAYRTFHSAR